MWYLFAQTIDKTVEAAAKTGEVAKSAVEAAKTAVDAAASSPAAEKAADAVADGGSVLGMISEFFDSGALHYMKEGGLFMWPILIMGIAVLGVIIERFRSMKMLGTDATALREDVLQLMRADRVEEALQLCEREQGPVPAILATGLRKFFVLRRLNYDAGRIEEQVNKSMDDYGVHIVAALEKHLPILATCASAAPMVGFLGTVQGMVISFADIVKDSGSKNIVELAAAGIMVALLTTVFGLIVGIPAFVGYNYFTSVINRFVLDVEEAGSELIETVTFQMALERGAGGMQASAPPAYSPPEV